MRLYLSNTSTVQGALNTVTFLIQKCYQKGKAPRMNVINKFAGLLLSKLEQTTNLSKAREQL